METIRIYVKENFMKNRTTRLVGVKLGGGGYVIEKAAKHHYWDCICHCGARFTTRDRNITCTDGINEIVFGCKKCSSGYRKTINTIKRKKKNDLVGKKLVGGGEVISASEKYDYWKCKCHCGEFFLTRTRSILCKEGRTEVIFGCKDCRIKRNKERHKNNRASLTNLVGYKFRNNCEVLEVDTGDYGGNTHWFCKCGCGKVFRANQDFITHEGCKDLGGCEICRKKFLRDTDSLIGHKLRGGGKVIAFSHMGKDFQSYWKCQCKCGKYFLSLRTVILGTKDKPGRYGCKQCSQKYIGSQLNKNNETIGKRFGKLTVLREADFSSSGMRYWCKCDCGKEKIIIGRNLRLKNQKSCGCAIAEANKLRSGPNHPFWIHDERERENRKHNHKCTTEWSRLRKRVAKRDKHTCKKCGKRHLKWHMHHLNAWKKFKKERFDINNVIYLCVSCHRQFHSIYGRGDNTEVQFLHYLTWY